MRAINIIDGVVVNVGVFKDGDDLPDGWHGAPDNVGKGWTDNGDGTYSAPAEPEPAFTPLDFELAIDDHINSVARSKGYNSIDSIAKYLVDGNPFKDEAESLSLWTGSVWMAANDILNDWQNGEIIEPSIDEVISQLPEPPQ